MGGCFSWKRRGAGGTIDPSLKIVLRYIMDNNNYSKVVGKSTRVEGWKGERNMVVWEICVCIWEEDLDLPIRWSRNEVQRGLFNMESSDKRLLSPRTYLSEIGRGSFITWLGEPHQRDKSRGAISREASGFLEGGGDAQQWSNHHHVSFSREIFSFEKRKMILLLLCELNSILRNLYRKIIDWDNIATVVVVIRYISSFVR